METIKSNQFRIGNNNNISKNRKNYENFHFIMDGVGEFKGTINNLKTELNKLIPNFFENKEWINKDEISISTAKVKEDPVLLKVLYKFIQLRELDSIKSLLSTIESIKLEFNIDNKFNIYYRGQSSFIHDLTPSIYRKYNDDYLSDSKESEVINEVLAEKPQDFIDSKTLFEKLIKMQHYGIPTRILDLTSNPLIALYFACADKTSKNNDASIFIFLQDRNKVLNPFGNKVALLSNLALMDKVKLCKQKASIYTVYWEQLRNYINEIFKNIKEKDKHLYYLPIQYLTELHYLFKKMEEVSHYTSEKNIAFHEKVKSIISSKGNTEIPNIDTQKLWQIVQTIHQYEHSSSCQNCIDKKARKNCKEKLLGLVRREYPAFQDRIQLDDLIKWRIIGGIKNNPRILAQSGAFIISPKTFEIIKDKENNYKGNNSVYSLEGRKFNANGNLIDIDESILDKELMENLKKEEPIIVKVKILNSKKDKILKELALLGINHSTVYPELYKYGDYLKETL